MPADISHSDLVIVNSLSKVKMFQTFLQVIIFHFLTDFKM